MLFNSFMVSESNMCMITEGTMYLIWNRDYNNHTVINYCTQTFARYSDYQTSKFGLVTQLDIDFVVGLVPIFIFVLTAKPHDCFKCFGKAPDLPYSIF